MKKTSFLMALACFGLLITGCNPGSTPSESKPTSTSGNASTSSKPSTSSTPTPSSSSVAPDPETYYFVTQDHKVIVRERYEIEEKTSPIIQPIKLSEHLKLPSKGWTKIC